MSEFEWIICEDREPNQYDRYAGRYGVPILGLDMDEPGINMPHMYHYDWEEGYKQLASGPKGTIWVPAYITHWCELPEAPNE